MTRTKSKWQKKKKQRWIGWIFAWKIIIRRRFVKNSPESESIFFNFTVWRLVVDFCTIPGRSFSMHINRKSWIFHSSHYECRIRTTNILDNNYAFPIILDSERRRFTMMCFFFVRAKKILPEWVLRSLQSRFVSGSEFHLVGISDK